jgi:hypothetical protein
MEHFSDELCKKLKSYVYRLIDPRDGNTFYVGRGRNNRLFEHVNEALNFNKVKDIDEQSSKIKTIREINNKGFKVIHVIQRWGLEEKEAKEVEAALIDAYPGLTNAVKGYGVERGATHAEELIERYNTKPFEIDESDEKFIVIKIRLETATQYGNYEATRKSWVLKLSRVKNYKIVLSTINGIVREVYRVHEWFETDDKKRCYFDGVIAEDNIRTKYLDKRLPDKFIKKGLANPALYSDKSR